MPPLPKRKTAHARQGERRSHLALQLKSLILCSQCRSPKMPHRVCPVCGTLNGMEIVKPRTRKSKAS
ncbi:MAG: 50S ribosomal protein L32 [Chloroflexi bacterium]|nr:50S ribosomal protein L32 [Chloroflexota bacterium]